MDLSDVIFAVASPPGRSLRGIVRVSGDEVFALLGPHVDRTIEAHHPSTWPVRLKLGALQLPVLLLTFPGPRSYTGQHSAELQLPGNPILLDRVIDELLTSAESRNIDARRAEPGEFTARAFFNGRLSLVQAEGVAALIAAQSDAQLAAANHLTTGKLGALAADLADRTATAMALVEAGIDFTDQDDVVPIAPPALLGQLQDLCSEIGAHLGRATGMEQLDAIPRVVLAGPPNAGKSTLFNALLARQRVVESPIAGATRDVIAEPLKITTPDGPAEVMLVDLAGLGTNDTSTVGVLMQEAAHQAIERADLVIYCLAIDDTLTEPPATKAGQIVVRTKGDLIQHGSDDELVISARTGEGLDRIRAIIVEKLAARAISLDAEALALMPRHEAALRRTGDHLKAAAAIVAPNRDERHLADPELVAAEMRSALDALADLAGEMTPDDVLGRVFATFCIGK